MARHHLYRLRFCAIYSLGLDCRQRYTRNYMQSSLIGFDRIRNQLGSDLFTLIWYTHTNSLPFKHCPVEQMNRSGSLVFTFILKYTLLCCRSAGPAWIVFNFLNCFMAVYICLLQTRSQNTVLTLPWLSTGVWGSTQQRRGIIVRDNDVR